MNEFDELIKKSALTKEQVEELTGIQVDDNTADKCLILLAEILSRMPIPYNGEKPTSKWKDK